jgi:FixJ family two-component response regulator
VQIMRAGGLDVIEKPAEDKTVREVVSKAIARDQELRTQLGGLAAVNDRIARLTPREKQVFELVAAGRLSREIATDLGISVNTVEIHRTRVMRKMEAGTVADLVRQAVAAGVVK